MIFPLHHWVSRVQNVRLFFKRKLQKYKDACASDLGNEIEKNYYKTFSFKPN